MCQAWDLEVKLGVRGELACARSRRRSVSRDLLSRADISIKMRPGTLWEGYKGKERGTTVVWDRVWNLVSLNVTPS